MAQRERNYFIIQKLRRIERRFKRETCPEFPFFGARYNDATCIEGQLWDLDRCDENGMLYSHGDNPPCPFCNAVAHMDYWGMTPADFLPRIKATIKRYA